MPLPEPFPCPVCEADDVLVRADVYIWLGALSPASGYDFDLADKSSWYCENCGHGGGVDENGPVEGTTEAVGEDNR